jgi:hypothetical protein
LLNYKSCEALTSKLCVLLCCMELHVRSWAWRSEQSFVSAHCLHRAAYEKLKASFNSITMAVAIIPKIPYQQMMINVPTLLITKNRLSVPSYVICDYFILCSYRNPAVQNVAAMCSSKQMSSFCSFVLSESSEPQTTDGVIRQLCANTECISLCYMVNNINRNLMVLYQMYGSLVLNMINFTGWLTRSKLCGLTL